MDHFFSSNRFGRGASWAVVLLAGLLPVAAHGPFDHSARLLVSGSRLEFVVTMGADATQAFLAAAGLSPDKGMEVLSRASGQPPLELPKAVGPRLVEIRAGDRVLEVGAIRVRTDGLDTLFTVTFPQPGSDTLDVRAVYFNGIEAMKQGAFVAVDENELQLGAALWSRANDSVRIVLPEKATGEIAWELVAATDITAVEGDSLHMEPGSKPGSAPGQRGDLRPGAKRALAVVAVVLIALLVLLGRRSRRWSSP